MEKLLEARANLHCKLLKLRAIERIITLPLFDTLFSDCEDKELVINYIKEEDKDNIEKWIKTERYKQYNLMPTKQLRKIAKDYGIFYYGNLTKATLLSEIIQHEKSIRRDKDSA